MYIFFQKVVQSLPVNSCLVQTFPQGLLQQTASGEQLSSSVHDSALNGHSVNIGHLDGTSFLVSNTEKEKFGITKYLIDSNVVMLVQLIEYGGNP